VSDDRGEAPQPEPIDPRAERAAGTMRARVASRIAEVMSARGRVLEHAEGSTDDEAVHDYRVGLRRLRSALRALRPMWSKKALQPLEASLKALADATGDVRDEEVLAETLARVPLSEEASKHLATWRRGRSRRLHGARGLASRRLAGAELGGQLHATLHAIEIALAEPPPRPTTMHRLAKRSVVRSLEEVERRAVSTHRDDVEGMHTLRIRVKRLRYAIELVFEGGSTGVALKASAKLQKRLGEIHDLDEAKVRIGRSWGLERVVRHEIADRLSEQRHKLAGKAMRELLETMPVLAREVGALVASLDEAMAPSSA